MVKRVRDLRLGTRMIILSVSRDENMVMEALHAGADAYLLKDGPGRHLLDAINYIREGRRIRHPAAARRQIVHRGAQNRQRRPFELLKPAGTEVFAYLVNVSGKDIADLLQISPKTVDTYRASLMRKLNVHDLVGLVKFAIERNLTSTSSITS